MKRPGGLRGFVGTPIVALAVIAGGCLGGYAWYLNPDAWPLALMGLVAMGWAIEASGEVARYRAWKRAWDSMGSGGSPSAAPSQIGPKIAVAGVGLIVIGFCLAATSAELASDPALTWLVQGGIALLVVGLAIHRFRSSARPFWQRPARPRQAEPVSICVRGPLIQPPSLKGAYDALPEHCWRALNAS